MEALMTLLGQESNLLKNKLEDWSIERTRSLQSPTLSGPDSSPENCKIS